MKIHHTEPPHIPNGSGLPPIGFGDPPNGSGYPFPRLGDSFQRLRAAFAEASACLLIVDARVSTHKPMPRKYKRDYPDIVA
ncbi:MAG: hypothetical protein M0R80_14495 [Proteobacteria bacterium]|nr:hypothetical protein [Pseudomonadota bacterium]